METPDVYLDTKFGIKTYNDVPLSWEGGQRNIDSSTSSVSHHLLQFATTINSVATEEQVLDIKAQRCCQDWQSDPAVMNWKGFGRRWCLHVVWATRRVRKHRNLPRLRVCMQRSEGGHSPDCGVPYGQESLRFYRILKPTSDQFKNPYHWLL
jgi:hypothetical protein